MPVRLPPLPYACDALEPRLDAETVHLHHTGHHAGYVAGFNQAESALRRAARGGDHDAIRTVERSLAYYGSGHRLHTLYWNGMGPAGRSRPLGPLAERIEEEFGSFDSFQALFSSVAVAVEASGWGILAWDREPGRLRVLQVGNHQVGALWGAEPILACDVWEHAYYLQYRNRRAEYVAAWWECVDWERVETRFSAVAQGAGR